MFDRLLALLVTPLQWAMNWFPRIAVLHQYEGGVRVYGDSVRTLKPGWYWWVPNVHEILTDNVVRKARATPDQLLLTLEGKRVRVGSVLVFRVVEIQRWLVENEDPDEAILTEAERVVREAITSGVEGDLTFLAREILEPAFGVEIERLAVTNFAETDAIDHSGINLVMTR
jgi:hypothetical protein